MKINKTFFEKKKYLLWAIKTAYKAGEAILKIYNSSADFKVKTKEDNSPVTIADKKSHDIILSSLSGNNNRITTPPLPVLSEEGRSIPFSERKGWEYFWLVDPLDGTKEFIKRNHEFTVNIALIHKNRPVIGVVYAPVLKSLYFASQNLGSYKLVPDTEENNKFVNSPIEEIILESNRLPLGFEVNSKGKKLAKDRAPSSITILASRSHLNAETKMFIKELNKKYDKVEIRTVGSSLKLCLVAEGAAAIYPRLGPTMEWDIAAAHVVVNEAGKKVEIYEKDRELEYNKKDLVNPWFVVK